MLPKNSGPVNDIQSLQGIAIAGKLIPILYILLMNKMNIMPFDGLRMSATTRIM